MKSSTRQKQIRQAAHSTPSPPVSPSPAPPFTCRELLLLAVVLIIGIGLRLYALSHSAVEHFDEGIYASNMYFGAPDYAYPLQRFFGPPLLPALIETGMVLQLPPNVAALLPSFLAGCGTIVALWWTGRSWFGPPAGLAAATLATFSDFHILFSTSALTDTLLGLWLLLAVDAIARSLVNGDLRWAVAAGLCTGLAWWTKFNGWLPLAIEAAAISLLLLAEFVRMRGSSNGTGSGTRNRLLSSLPCFALTCLVAAAVWSPYFFSLQTHGGYSPIAANHAKYLVGLSGWLDSTSRQLANHQVIESPLSSLGLLIAISLPVFLTPGSTRDRLLFAAIATAAAATSLFCTTFLVLTTFALAGLVLTIATGWPLISRDPLTSDLRSLSSSFLLLLAVWWLGLLLTTSLYVPYARLTLPLTLATYLAAPLILHGAGLWPAQQPIPSLRPVNALPVWVPLLACPAVLVTSIAITLFLPRHQLHLSHNRLALQTIAREIHQTTNDNTPRVIYSYAEPALFFQLRAAGEAIVSPIQNVPTTAATIDGQPVPTFLLTGPHTEQDTQFQQEWLTAHRHWKLLQSFGYRPSPLVHLDLHDPRATLIPDSAHSIHLYKLTNDK